MRVTLIDRTPVDVLFKAAAMPYQSRPTEGLVKRVWESGHRSIARHGMASFLVEGVSQSLLKQLSRHPHVNLTVKSARYCSFEDTECVVPPSLKWQDRLEYADDYNTIMIIYEKWNRREGYTEPERREMAKLMLPLGSTTSLVISGNFQALYEFLQLRLCKRAEWEIRKMAGQMAEVLKDQVPVIFENLGCKGDELSYCPETHGACGKHPKKPA
ncbi:predicted alternative thymidylate synthase [Pelotomaculum thermopropionicum SI]|uniref:FAD-dependent thymidylate synthase n=1 Tax=Pelotomaculum thermopropionicum (strain DSM 13744 / JCM 10971 / SI) TaxID=370438 RepID=A5D0A6_PELTS|nr:predicted alternative thymidylate synthase [Pelotomaculum thermopropionicum SI]